MKSKKLTSRAIGVAGILVSIIAVWYIARSFDFKSAFTHVKNVGFLYPVLLSSIYVTTFFVRAFRWKHMFVKDTGTPFRTYLQSVVIGFAGNNILPARGGELLRTEFFARTNKSNRIEVLTSVLTEKILDGLILLLLLVAVVLLHQNLLESVWVRNLTYTASLIFLGALLAIVLLRAAAMKVIHTIRKIIKRTIANKLCGILVQIARAVRFLAFDKRSALVLLSSAIIWIIEAIVFILALEIFGIESSASNILAGTFCLTVVNFGILIPSSPGYIGVFQGMTILALSAYLVDENIALGVAIIVHLSQYVPITLWGAAIAIKQSVSLTRRN